jgi:hypothetical protein
MKPIARATRGRVASPGRTVAAALAATLLFVGSLLVLASYPRRPGP